jgi:hypothetical protein
MTIPVYIKRSTTTATPASLAVGELAYSENSGNLFIGETGSLVTKIGGESDVLKLAGIAPGAEVNLVSSVAGRVGDVVIVSSDLADFNSSVTTQINALSIEALSDVDNSMTPSDGQFLKWDNGSGHWTSAAVPGGVSNFVELNDTPVNFTGAADYLCVVNSAGTAVEFIEAIDGGTF